MGTIDDIHSATQNGVVAVNNLAGFLASIPTVTLKAGTSFGTSLTFQNNAQVASVYISSAVNTIATLNYSDPGDLGGAVYARVGSEPSHAGKIQSADGAWWEISEVALLPEMLGAKADGSDDFQHLQDTIDTAIAIGADVDVPPSKTYNTSAVIEVASRLKITGGGREASLIQVMDGVDASCMRIQSGASSTILQAISLVGARVFGTTNSTLIVEANEAYVANNDITGGEHCIRTDCADTLYFNNKCRYAYGSSLVYSVQGAQFIRNKLDQQYPAGVFPAGGTSISDWAAATAYVVGDIVRHAGQDWLIQVVAITGGGVSGGSEPTILQYEQNMVDNEVTWNAVAPTNYKSYEMSESSQETWMVENDHSGCFSNAIAMNGTAPFSLSVLQAIIGQQRFEAILCEQGGFCTVQDSGIGCGWDSAEAACIKTQPGFTGGQLRVIGNEFTGGNSIAQGVKLFGGFSQAVISNNICSGTFASIVLIDTGSGTFSDIVIANNTSDGASIDIQAGVDWYIVQGNNTHGAGVNDAGGGANKSVTGNI